MEQTKLKRFKRIILIIAIGLLLCTGGLITMYASSDVVNEQVEHVEKIDSIKNDVNTISKKEQIQQEIINEVQAYINKQSPKAHQFIPKYLVTAGLKHNIDICFIMAQTQIETNFGVGGAGRETSRRSMFGVAIRKYANYEDAINDYCQILNKSYLGKGRTERHLMTKYVTHTGLRYAASRTYEAELSKTYKNIVNKTNIYNLQQEWKKSL